MRFEACATLPCSHLGIALRCCRMSQCRLAAISGMSGTILQEPPCTHVVSASPFTTSLTQETPWRLTGLQANHGVVIAARLTMAVRSRSPQETCKSTLRLSLHLWPRMALRSSAPHRSGTPTVTFSWQLWRRMAARSSLPHGSASRPERGPCCCYAEWNCAIRLTGAADRP